MIGQFKHGKIEEVLKGFPSTRADDKLLCLCVWDKEGLKLDSEQAKIFLGKCTPGETITRARRELQQHGFYLPSQEIIKERKEKAEKIKEYFNKQNKLL